MIFKIHGLDKAKNSYHCKCDNNKLDWVDVSMFRICDAFGIKPDQYDNEELMESLIGKSFECSNVIVTRVIAQNVKKKERKCRN